MVSTKVFVAFKFLSRPLCLDKKIANCLIPNFVTLKFCPFWFSSGFLFILSFFFSFFLEEREVEL